MIVSYVINSGFAVGTPINLTQYPWVRAIGVPLLSSADLLIQGAMGQANGAPPSSGEFARMLDNRAVGSAQLRFATGPGSLWIPLPSKDFYGVFPQWIRPELAVAQGAQRTLTILLRA